MTPETIGNATLYLGDVLQGLESLPDESVQTCITSPPYWGLRDYGHPDQIGLEPTLGEYIEKLVAVFAEVRRVLRPDGTCWINLGDAYCTRPPGGVGHNSTINGTRTQAAFREAGGQKRPADTALKYKDLIGQPWRVAFALQDAGWYLRQDIIWHKPNPMPESVRDRCTKAHEYLFLLSKSRRYYYDQEAIKEPASPDTHPRYGRSRNPSDYPGNQTIASSFEHMRAPGVNPKAAKPVAGWAKGPGPHDAVSHTRRHNGETKMPRIKQNASFAASVKDTVEMRNKRSVWTVPTFGYPEAHFATFPPDLIRPCVLAGAPEDGVVLDPFAGSGTTGQVALEHGRRFVGIELNPDYMAMVRRRVLEAQRQARLFA